GDRTVLAKQIIDGESEGQFAAAAGAPFTVGWASLGVRQRMADTLVFGVHGVDWQALTRAVQARGGGYAHVRDNVVWGPFGGYPAAYRPQQDGLRLRGLNLGLESDGTVLVNALLVYGADPLDPASLAAARQRAAAEVPSVVRYLAAGIPGFEHAQVSGVAPQLYVRESRHLEAQCVLHANDVLDNRVTDEAVAAGGYPLDVQSLTLHDTGFVFGTPVVYGARLCMAVAPHPAPLWVVGKTAGFDPIAFASARVVPFGMALGEAVGVAAARAASQGLDPAALASSPAQVQAVRSTLAARGAYLPSVEARAPVGPVSSPYFHDFRLLLGRGLAVGGYGNDPHLDKPVTEQSFLYLLSNVAQRFFGNAAVGPALVGRYGVRPVPLRPAIALSASYDAACQLGGCPAEPTWTALQRAGLVPQGFAPDGPLDRGQAYALAAGLARMAGDGPPP
ncbi:MAG: FAD-dependent oxidoreductase, partial [Deinococcales bacterium]